MVAVQAAVQEVPSQVSTGNVNIHPWEQIVHSFRTQVTSIHHNVSAAIAGTFGPTWRPKSTEPVWLLGHRYSVRSQCEDEEASAEGTPHELSECDGIAGHCKASSSSCRLASDDGQKDFDAAWAQITRMTYRRGFAPMYRCVRAPGGGVKSSAPRSYIRLTSDAGWGCMIRVGQMLLATALKRHFAGSLDDPIECKFIDDPCATRSPFSIFEFIRAAHGREVAVPPSESEDAKEANASNQGGRQGMRSGSSCGAGGFRTGRQLTQKMPGDWFGPTTISETIAALVERNEDLRDSLAVYVDADGVLYEDEVRALADGLEGPRWKPPPSSPSLCSASWKPWHSHSDRATEESEDEFQVLSTASNICSPNLSVSSASNICSPPLLPVPADASDDLEEPRNSDVTEFLEFELPPAVVPLEPCQEEAAELRDASMSGRAVSSSSAPAGENNWKREVLLLFPLQLGCEKYVGEDRVSAVLRYFEIESSLGAMGGRPRMAHFFVGRQGQGLLYVDPHVVQAAVPAARSDTGENHSGGFAGAETFRNLPTVQTIPVEHIDSSISFAFYVRSEAALSELVKTLRGIEAAEASAPIRVESTRPAALRHVEVTESWGDGDLVLEESAEVAAKEMEEPSFHEAGSSGYGEEKVDVPMETQEAPSDASFISNAAPEHSAVAVTDPCTDLYVVGEEDLCWPHFEACRELKPSTVSFPGGTVSLPDGGTICVGSSWADGRWAQADRRTVSHSVSAA
eukprot:TRINITY_DN14940_c0_g1_i2.p1 TRINITY_DN14940_c0_g1~~TRINITY_DN14940_c0_g1_i2.p1  ORF type:complete len:762 (-),score=139.51 TRINITY_DN14940_c0_g1_i2:70-2292(-)